MGTLLALWTPWALGACGSEGGPAADAGQDTAQAGPQTDTELLARGQKLLAEASCKNPSLPMTCPGAAAPAFALEDFQPKSARFGQSYGLEAFKGKVFILAMLSGW